MNLLQYYSNLYYSMQKTIQLINLHLKTIGIIQLVRFFKPVADMQHLIFTLINRYSRTGFAKHNTFNDRR